MNMPCRIGFDDGAFTDEQEAVIAKGASLPDGAHLRVKAGAGSGKTTTLHGIAGARGSDRGLYLAFNGDTARHARARFSDTHCRAATFHSVALAAASREIAGRPANWYHVKSDVFPHRAFASGAAFPRVRGWSSYMIAMAMLRTMSVFCASDAPAITPEHAREAIVVETGDPDVLKGDDTRERAAIAISRLARPLADAAQAFFDDKITEGHFTHDVYLKLVATRSDLTARAFRGVDYVIVDEAQDLNPVQIQLLRGAGTSIVAVGDTAQAIYAWRGAVSALERLPGGVATLSNSFRFGPDIATLANKVLGQSPEADLGVRVTGVGGSLPESFEGTRYAVLCRTNAAILEEATALARAGQSYHVDKSDQLRAEILSALAIYKDQLHAVSLPEYRVYANWAEVVAEASGNRNLEHIVKIIESGGAVDALAVLDQGQPRNTARVALMTGHRSKGLEFPVVKMGPDWFSLKDLSQKAAEARALSPRHVTAVTQEYNVLYVAFTRAMQRVVGFERLVG